MRGSLILFMYWMIFWLLKHLETPFPSNQKVVLSTQDRHFIISVDKEYSLYSKRPQGMLKSGLDVITIFNILICC